MWCSGRGYAVTADSENTYGSLESITNYIRAVPDK